MRKILDFATWGFLVLFFVPTVLILASWYSLPGDNLYGVKLGLEQALLIFVKPSYAASGALSVKYTERRFSETKRLLADKQSVGGLPYLERQVTATRAVIERAPNQKAQKDLARTYLATLLAVSAELETQKQAIAAAQKAAPRPIARKRSSSKTSTNEEPQTPPETNQTSEPQTFFIPQFFAPQPTQTPESQEITQPTVEEQSTSTDEQAQKVEQQISDTQEELQVTIDELTVITESKTDENMGGNDKKQEDKKNKPTDHPEGNNEGQGNGN